MVRPSSGGEASGFSVVCVGRRDSREFRDNARALLDRQEGIEVVAEAADGRAAVEWTGLARPEVVLMDIELPALDGIEATRKIRARGPEVQVVPLTIWDRPVFREAMAEAGAVGYVLEDGEPGELIDAIRRAAPVDAPRPPVDRSPERV